jgi:hypothetical protein
MTAQVTNKNFNRLRRHVPFLQVVQLLRLALQVPQLRHRPLPLLLQPRQLALQVPLLFVRLEAERGSSARRNEKLQKGIHLFSPWILQLRNGPLPLLQQQRQLALLIHIRSPGKRAK